MSFGSSVGTTSVKFNAPQEIDTRIKTETCYVQTKQQCILFMREYKERSIEELRIEDYNLGEGPCIICRPCLHPLKPHIICDSCRHLREHCIICNPCRHLQRHCSRSTRNPFGNIRQMAAPQQNTGTSLFGAGSE